MCAGTLNDFPVEVDAAGPLAVEDVTNVLAVEDSEDTACATLNNDGWLMYAYSLVSTDGNERDGETTRVQCMASHPLVSPLPAPSGDPLVRRTPHRRPR